MAEEKNQKGNVFSANDPLDINELASLNDDISPEFIEQLQSQVAQNASQFTGKPVTLGSEDSELFEEVTNEEKSQAKVTFDDSIDDNFIKKYKAKINKQQKADIAEKEELAKKEKEETVPTPIEKKNIPATEVAVPVAIPVETKPVQPEINSSADEIENLTSGNIIEKPAVQEQIDYNESLDFLDENIKYSKYVIYVDPENTEFIESLTVKERKNLINRILREQDDIAITKKRLNLIQTIIKHSIIAVITISIAIPVVYWTVNASLEATINNYRRSQTLFKTLYRDKGKIKHQNNY